MSSMSSVAVRAIEAQHVQHRAEHFACQLTTD
jgi:hypothetical protein